MYSCQPDTERGSEPCVDAAEDSQVMAVAITCAKLWPAKTSGAAVILTSSPDEELERADLVVETAGEATIARSLAECHRHGRHGVHGGHPHRHHRVD